MTEITYMRLSQLTGEISKSIEQAFATRTFWILAEITDHAFKSQKKYHNFILVEKDPHINTIIAKVSAAAWGSATQRIANFEKVTGQRFTNNISVLINVAVRYHPVYGLSLALVDIDTSYTLGALERQRQATLERLVKENPGYIRKEGDLYITKNKELKLNAVIQNIAMISSKTSAGDEDFRHTLNNNPYGYKFFIDDYPTLVQGEANAAQLVQKIIEVWSVNKAYDAVVIVRGGGASTDFLIFDNYHIGQAIAKFPIPIFTGIGHQKNESIADLMAHMQLKTPTQVAEFIIDHNRTFEESLLRLQKNILIKSQQLFHEQSKILINLNNLIVNKSKDFGAHKREQLLQVNQAIIQNARESIFHNKSSIVNLTTQILARPKAIIYSKNSDIKNIINNVATFKSQYLKNQNSHLAHFAATIKLMAPANILKKGFAILKVDGKVVGNADDIRIGLELDVILADTEIKTVVTKKSKYNVGGEFNL